MESILNSTKKLLGIDAEYNAFDSEIVMHINSALMTLTGMGIGPSTGFIITGEDEEWSEFSEDSKIAEHAKIYVYLKTKTLFDPPTSSAVQTAIDASIKELEWRMYIHCQNLED